MQHFVQAFRQKPGNYVSTICSGSHVYGLGDGTTRESLAQTIVSKCAGRQGFLLVSGAQRAANRAINALARRSYLYEAPTGEVFKFKVRRLGRWAPDNWDSDSRMVVISAHEKY